MAAVSIPLHCTICPKRPTFSDVSHLLTHIASKGHLSHYYKVKVRSGSEEASRRVIDSYDRWYADWNVENLMSERMNHKDRKRARTSKVTGPHRQNKGGVASQGRGKSQPHHHLDPRITGQSIKPETQPTPPPSLTDSAPHQRAHALRMHLWTAAFPTPISSGASDVDNGGSRADDLFAPMMNQFMDGLPTCTDGARDGGEVLISECTKLKGVYWPGMDIFDSATPEMRRKRNQKKDVSVVEQLELNSLEVEPTELVFTPLGSLKKFRKISGFPDSDSSPIKDPSPPKKPRGRVPLGQLDVNCPRRNQAYADQLFFQPNHSIYDENEGTGYSLPSGNGVQRRCKRTFDIFQDEISFAQPAGMTYLNSAFTGPSYLETFPTALDFKPTTQGDGAEQYQYEDKEIANYGEDVHGISGSLLYGEFNEAANASVYTYDSFADPFVEHRAADSMGHDFPAFSSHTMPFGDFKPTGTALDGRDGHDDERTITAPPSEP